MRINFPFAALVGQDALKDALLWIAVDPRIGGLLITGTRGTAKSTAARALADLLPPGTPFVDLPVGATEDRVIGTLDVRALLAGGERRFEPGLLARANEGVLYVDEVNLLPDHIVDVLLDAAATGRNIVERDGASYSHEARIMLVGSMNPEEGELRPQLLDRFGLCVSVENDGEVERRAQITERRIQFELAPERFCAAYEFRSQQLRERIVQARELLARIVVDRETLEHASRLAIEANVEGMRADLTIVRAARAIAALRARDRVSLDDIECAAPAALAHRRRDVPPPSPPRTPRGDTHNNGEAGGRSDSERRGSEQKPVVFDVGAAIDERLPDCAPAREPNGGIRMNAARGRSSIELARGMAFASTQHSGAVAALATIRAAAVEHEPHDGALQVAEHHMRYVHRRGRERQLVIFVVDASGSMAAAQRMSAAKGAVCGLLEQAYYRRDAVALVAFRGEGAEVIVPPTRSAALAYRRLRVMATGGRTPLAHGLRIAAQTAVQYARRDAGARSHLVLVTDARANVPEQNAFGDALSQAAALRALGVRALCIDTEGGRIRLGNAIQLAQALGAQYRHIAECNEGTLRAAVREWMAIA
jgi:magnesium chelatase subunit D